MPSVINPRSGPFPVYSSTSPPTIDVGQFAVSKTGVDLKTTGTIAIFTVPAGRTFVCTGSYAVVTAVSNGGAGTCTWQIKESSANRLMSETVASTSSTPVATQTVYYEGVRPNAVILSTCTAGNNVNSVFATNNAGSTTVTGTFFVTGFYSS